MLDRIDGCFKRLQTLQIQPTLENMEKLVQTLYDLKDIYKVFETMEKKEAAEDGRTETDPE